MCSVQASGKRANGKPLLDEFDIFSTVIHSSCYHCATICGFTSGSWLGNMLTLFMLFTLTFSKLHVVYLQCQLTDQHKGWRLYCVLQGLQWPAARVPRPVCGHVVRGDPGSGAAEGDEAETRVCLSQDWGSPPGLRATHGGPGEPYHDPCVSVPDKLESIPQSVVVWFPCYWVLDCHGTKELPLNGLLVEVCSLRDLMYHTIYDKSCLWRSINIILWYKLWNTLLHTV